MRWVPWHHVSPGRRSAQASATGTQLPVRTSQVVPVEQAASLLQAPSRQTMMSAERAPEHRRSFSLFFVHGRSASPEAVPPTAEVLPPSPSDEGAPPARSLSDAPAVPAPPLCDLPVSPPQVRSSSQSGSTAQVESANRAREVPATFRTVLDGESTNFILAISVGSLRTVASGAEPCTPTNGAVAFCSFFGQSRAQLLGDFVLTLASLGPAEARLLRKPLLPVAASRVSRSTKGRSSAGDRTPGISRAPAGAATGTVSSASVRPSRKATTWARWAMRSRSSR